MAALTCPYPCATLDQATAAGMNLYQYLTGAVPSDVGCEIQCAIALASYANSVVFPDGCPQPPEPGPMTAKKRADARKELAAALKPLVDAKGKAATAFDWKAILKLAIQFLLTWLG